MNALRIALAWREQVDHQQVNALHDQFRDFSTNVRSCIAARLVAGRDDLDHGDDVSVPVPHSDTTRPSARKSAPRHGGTTASRTGTAATANPAAAAVRFVSPRPRWQSQGEHVRNGPADRLLRQREVICGRLIRHSSRAERDNPAVMESMEQPRVNAGPVVNRHGLSLRAGTEIRESRLYPHSGACFDALFKSPVLGP